MGAERYFLDYVNRAKWNASGADSDEVLSLQAAYGEVARNFSDFIKCTTRYSKSPVAHPIAWVAKLNDKMKNEWIDAYMRQSLGAQEHPEEVKTLLTNALAHVKERMDEDAAKHLHGNPLDFGGRTEEISSINKTQTVRKPGAENYFREFVEKKIEELDNWEDTRVFEENMAKKSGYLFVKEFFSLQVGMKNKSVNHPIAWMVKLDRAKQDKIIDDYLKDYMKEYGTYDIESEIKSLIRDALAHVKERMDEDNAKKYAAMTENDRALGKFADRIRDNLRIDADSAAGMAREFESLVKKHTEFKCFADYCMERGWEKPEDFIEPFLARKANLRGGYHESSRRRNGFVEALGGTWETLLEEKLAVEGSTKFAKFVEELTPLFFKEIGARIFADSFIRFAKKELRIDGTYDECITALGKEENEAMFWGIVDRFLRPGRSLSIDDRQIVFNALKDALKPVVMANGMKGNVGDTTRQMNVAGGTIQTGRKTTH